VVQDRSEVVRVKGVGSDGVTAEGLGSGQSKEVDYWLSARQTNIALEEGWRLLASGQTVHGAPSRSSRSARRASRYSSLSVGWTWVGRARNTSQLVPEPGSPSSAPSMILFSSLLTASRSFPLAPISVYLDAVRLCMMRIDTL